MAWYALRRVKLRGRQYEKGDEIRDADHLRNRRVLVDMGYLVNIPDAEQPGDGPKAPDTAPTMSWKREDLDAYAVGIGISDAPAMQNKQEVLDAIGARMAADGAASETATTTTTPSPTTTAAPTTAPAPASLAQHGGKAPDQSS